MKKHIFSIKRGITQMIYNKVINFISMTNFLANSVWLGSLSWNLLTQVQVIDLAGVLTFFF
jgi:hypothetical protein